MNKFLVSLLAAFILPAGLARAEEEPDFDGAPGQVAKAGVPAEMATFDDMISVLDKGYYDVKYHGLDWKKEVADTRAAIIAAKTRNERYSAMQALIAKLGHSHISLSVPGNPRSIRRASSASPLAIPVSRSARSKASGQSPASLPAAPPPKPDSSPASRSKPSTASSCRIWFLRMTKTKPAASRPTSAAGATAIPNWSAAAPMPARP